MDSATLKLTPLAASLRPTYSRAIIIQFLLSNHESPLDTGKVRSLKANGNRHKLGTEPAPARDHDTMLPLSGGGFVDRRYALLIFKSLCPDMRSEL